MEKKLKLLDGELCHPTIFSPQIMCHNSIPLVSKWTTLCCIALRFIHVLQLGSHDKGPEGAYMYSRQYTVESCFLEPGSSRNWDSTVCTSCLTTVHCRLLSCAKFTWLVYIHSSCEYTLYVIYYTTWDELVM